MQNFESLVLKKIIHSGEYFGKVFPIIESKFFKSIGNQKLFNLILEYYGQYHERPTAGELVALVKDVPNSEIRKSIIESLQEIANAEEVPNVQFMGEETLKWVKDSLYYEALTVGAEGLEKKSDDLKSKSQQIMDKMAKVTLDESLGLDFDDLQEMIRYFSERNIGILTNHKDINKRLGTGFLPGTLSVILAAQGVGKSLLMCDLISNMLKENHNILLVSLEMSDHEMMKRIYANVLDIDVNSFSDLSKTEGEIRNLDRNAVTQSEIESAYNNLKLSGKCGKLIVKDYPTGSFSALMLEDLVQKFHVEKGIDFDIIFIDYLGIMKSDLVGQSIGLYSYLKSVGEEIRASAKKLNVPIISASQLNRSAVGKTEGVDNSAISDSLGTAMTADFMMFILQTEQMKERCEVICKVTKNRFNGKTDSWFMQVDYPKMRFIDIAQSDFKSIGITPDFKTQSDNFAKTEIAHITHEDIAKVQEKDKEVKESKNDPFKGDDILKELGF